MPQHPTTDSSPRPAIIYKIVTREQWRIAEKAGFFDGAPVDLADGYIHFSTAETVAATAAKHFAGQNDLLLVAANAADLGKELRYEVSRGGAYFPHLYDRLSLSSVAWIKELPLNQDGHHLFPELNQ